MKRATVVALTLVLAASAWPVLPAHGQQVDEVRLLLPDDGFEGGDATRLGDQFDGVDERAHLTAVSTAAADRHLFFLCDERADELRDHADGQRCIFVGEDAALASPRGTFKAGETGVDPDEDVGGWSVIVLACEGPPDDDLQDPDDDHPGAPDNCAGDMDLGVSLDDDGSAGTTSTGRLASQCPGDEPGDCARRAQFTPLVHGGSVPPNGFFVRATTSDDVSAPYFCLSLEPEDSATHGCDVVATDVRRLDDDDRDEHRSWQAVFPDDSYPEDAFVDVAVGCEPGSCEGHEGPLVLDRLLQATMKTTPGVDDDDISVSFEPGDCDDPRVETYVELEGEATLESTGVLGCVFDEQEELLREVEVTFESGGVGGFTECEGELHDHDLDGDREHCHVHGEEDDDTGAPSAFDAAVSNEVFAEDRGSTGAATILLCIDPEATGPSAGTEAEPAPGHGCADEITPPPGTATVHYVGDPEHAHIVVEEPGAADDPCHAGRETWDLVLGQAASVLLCTFDRYDQPASTIPVGEGRIRITDGDPGVVTFTTGAPNETDPDGRVRFDIRGGSRGTTFLRIQLICDPADDDVAGCPPDGVAYEDTLSISVVKPPPIHVRGSVSLSPRPGRRPLFRGRVKAPVARCRRGRRIRVKKVRRGPDRTVAADRTGRGGGFRGRVKRIRRGRYYAVAQRNVIRRSIGDIVCKRRTSPKIRVQV